MPFPQALPLLLLFALPLAAGAEPHARRPLVIRLSELERRDAAMREVYVAGGVSTIITTPWAVKARGTGVVGRGERPFEMLLGARRVVLTPRRPLTPGERFPFILRLSDETVVPLVLVAPSAPRGADGEVALAFDDDDAAELRVQLAAVKEQAQGLAERLRQVLLERDSEDFALAQLYAGGRPELAGLGKTGDRLLEMGDRSRVQLITYAPSSEPRHGARKVVAVVVMTNKGAEPVELQVGDLYHRSTLEMVTYAARVQPAVIAPGATGRLAVVLDAASIDDDETLTLEVRQRAGERATGREVDLAAQDFGASSWWSF